VLSLAFAGGRRGDDHAGATGHFLEGHRLAHAPENLVSGSIGLSFELTKSRKIRFPLRVASTPESLPVRFTKKACPGSQQPVQRFSLAVLHIL
jgi:hypothetical protein